MLLPELVADLERQVLDAERHHSTAPVADVLRAVVEELQPIVHTGGLDGAAAVAPDRMLTAREVAERLKMSVRWVYQHADDLPFARRIGKALRFSERGLEAWLRDRS